MANRPQSTERAPRPKKPTPKFYWFMPLAAHELEDFHSVLEEKMGRGEAWVRALHDLLCHAGELPLPFDKTCREHRGTCDGCHARDAARAPWRQHARTPQRPRRARGTSRSVRPEFLDDEFLDDDGNDGTDHDDDDDVQWVRRCPGQCLASYCSRACQTRHFAEHATDGECGWYVTDLTPATQRFLYALMQNPHADGLAQQQWLEFLEYRLPQAKIDGVRAAVRDFAIQCS
jgi:hypothetical protein